MSTSIVPMLARRIEIWPVERLVPYTRNARTHSPEQVAQIAASIIEFGFNAPILVASDAGIIAGHGRLLAARKLGLGEVPVVVLDHLSETQRRAYITSRKIASTIRRITPSRGPEAASWERARAAPQPMAAGTKARGAGRGRVWPRTRKAGIPAWRVPLT